MKVFYAAIAFLVVGVLLASAVNAYTINGSCVYHETQYYKIEQCPAVLNDLSNYVNLSVTNKHSQPHDIMLAYGFDTEVVKPKQAWRWGNKAHQVPTYSWASHSYTCDGDFNYSLDPKYFWCYDYNGTKKFEHSFVNGWVQNKTAEWFEWEVTGTETQWWNDWIDVSSVFTKQSFQGKQWYYAPQNISFAAHETKVLRALIQVQPNTQGKYDLYAWRGEWTPQEAWGDSTKSVLLDPWWNASWGYRKPITAFDGYGVDYYQEPININATGLTLNQSNCSELRATLNYTSETAVDVTILDNAGQSESLGSQWCLIQIPINVSSSQNASYAQKNDTVAWVYYGNPTAPDAAWSPLPIWDYRFQGSATPNSTGWIFSTAATPNYNNQFNLAGTTNGIWVANDTGSDPDATWFKIDGQSISSLTTVETRARVLASGGSGAYIFGGRLNGNQSCFVLVDSSSAGVGQGAQTVSSWYDKYSTVDTSKFHVYRAVCDGATTSYELWVDGVLVMSGTNSSVHGGAGASDFQLGEAYWAWANTLQHETDYGFVERNVTRRPLNATLGAQEAPSSINTSLNLTVLYANGSAVTLWNVNFTNASASFQYLNQNTSRIYTLSETPNGTINVTIWKTGYANYTNTTLVLDPSNYVVNMTVTLSLLGDFAVTCLDADTGAALANCGIRVENTTMANSSLGNYNGALPFTPTGAINITANKTGFASSVYYASWDGSSDYNVNAYLMNLSNPYAIYVRFHVRNVYNVPLENAFVNVTRMIGGSPVVVGQCYSDAAGDCAFYLSGVASYTIVTSLSGYYANTVSITPSINDYTITLSSSAVSGNYTLTNIFEDLRWGLFPNPRGLTNVSTNFSLIAVSDNCSLAYWGFNLSCNGSLITSQNTSTASCGGTLYYFANLTNCNGTQVTANYWFSRNPFVLGEAIFSWYLDAAEVEKTFTQWREDYADSGAGTIVFAIIALLVALFVGAWVARVNRAGAVIAIIAVLALALAANWLGDYGWVILTFTVIFVGAALFLRERVA